MDILPNIQNSLKNLDNRQLEIISKFINGDNIFMSGPAGTGKSFVINIINDICNIRKIKCHITALTGCAALLLNGNSKTLHSWSGIVINSYDLQYNLNKIRKNKTKRTNWLKVNVLIIDEVSMMSSELFDLLDNIGRSIRKTDKPFGGIQLILSGDFFQLPPIGDCKFCFQSKEWDNIFPTINILKKIYRQDDPVFTKILNKIRTGKVKSRTLINLLNDRLIKYKGDIVPTIILPNRAHVNRINERNHMKLGDIGLKKYEMKINHPKNENKSYNKSDIKYAIDNFIKSEIYLKELELKIGDQVICNRNISDKIVNGSRGVIIRISQYPTVRFLDGFEETMVPFEIQHETINGLSFSQIPLHYAWALTIHKCQGMSLDICQMDLGSNVFEYGQTYVALSRVKKLEGLYLLGLDIDKIKANPLVIQFYKNRRVKSVKMTIKDKHMKKTELIKNITEWCNKETETDTLEINNSLTHTIKRIKKTWHEKEDNFISDNRGKTSYMLYNLYLKEDFTELYGCEYKEKHEVNNRLKSLLNTEKTLFEKLELQKIPLNINLQLKLKQYRYCKSVKEAKPPYCIMTNNSLDIISRKQPTTVNELLEIKGIGKTFIDKYSEDVLEIIKEAIK